MEISQDFKEFLQYLDANQVEYIIVGGYAVAFHGAPRYTGDIDILVKTGKENGERVLKTLKDFGFGMLDITVDDFCSPDKVIQIGKPPQRIDILTDISGVSWDEIQAGKCSGSLNDLEVSFIGKKELIKNKKSSGRHKDLGDVEALGE